MVGLVVMQNYFYVLAAILIVSNALPNSEQWWGSEHLKHNQDHGIRPFKVHFDDDMIEYLQYRLTNHRPWTPPLEGVGFEYGFNTDALDSWLNYWAEQYPFKQQEDFLNKYPQFKTNIQGLDIHFLWVKPQVPKHVEVIPLLLIHGWPGSVREFYETIPQLTKYNPQKNFALEIIVPTLPGFGYSDAAVRPGLGAPEIGVVLRNLMHRLGFNKFFIQGGDWGAIVGASICTLYPDEVIGYHTNFAISVSPLSLAVYVAGAMNNSLVADASVQDRMYPILPHLFQLLRESGYFHMQATKPDTLGIAMGDSPAGQLAYIFQLMAYATRSDSYYSKDGRLDDYYERSSLIDNLMMYWSTNSFTTAARLYAESVNMRVWNDGVLTTSTPVPTCTVHPKYEIFYLSPVLLKYKFTNLLNSTVFDTYGHFLALEQPKIFSDSVLGCVETVRDWRGEKKCKDEL